MKMYAARGKVKEIIKNRAVVNIGTDENEVLTPPIEWSVIAAGSVSCQRQPSVGERVLLINTGDGYCLSDMVISGYFLSPDFPEPDNAKDSLSVLAGTFSFKFNTKGVVSTVAESITTTASNVTINALSSMAITATTVTVKAMVNITKSLIVTGINFLTHAHMGNGKGSKTGAPQ